MAHPPPSPHRLAVRHPGEHLHAARRPAPTRSPSTARHRRAARPAGPPRRAEGPAAAPLHAVRRPRRRRRRTRRPRPDRRRALDGRPGRGAPPRPAPGRLAPRAGLPGQGGRHRVRDPGRLLGRGGRLRAGPGSPGVAAVLAGPHRRPTAAARRAGRTCPARHRSGLGRPAPAVGPPRPGAGPGGAGRGDLRRGRRADRRHPPRRRRPGRGRRAARARLLGLPQAAPAGRISPRRMGHRRRLSAVRVCPKEGRNPLFF